MYLLIYLNKAVIYRIQKGPFIFTVSTYEARIYSIRAVENKTLCTQKKVRAYIFYEETQSTSTKNGAVQRV